MNKITTEHLKRNAYVYVRQSTMNQVAHNTESKRQQYNLKERAAELGWKKIIVIDEDLGVSGSGHITRSGFERLVSEVCQSNVGAIFATEASRLARNGHEWHRLLEFCGIVETLLVDLDGVYNPKHPNDRLLLGLKGTMSELEVSTFRQRSKEAVLQKARRGEYYSSLPAGYFKLPNGTLEKDPDEQIRHRIQLVFKKFNEFGSARQVYLWFVQENISLPKKECGDNGNYIAFGLPNYSLITGILKNPIYAGAYAFGRFARRTVIEDGRKRTFNEKLNKPEDWKVLIQDHHEGYITWEEYILNQEKLLQNTNRFGGMVKGAPRKGKGLLAGLIRCGSCGKKMGVNYSGRRGRSAVVYYQCRASQKQSVTKQNCSLFGGVWVEQAVEKAFLNALLPESIEIMKCALEQVDARQVTELEHLKLKLEKAHYDAKRCERQFNSVEPENRTVARTLEARWEKALEQVSEFEQELKEASECQHVFREEDRKALESLASNLPLVWHHPEAPFELKKRLLRTVIKELVVYVGKENIRVILHWQGGQHTELKIRKRRTGEDRWTTDKSTAELIAALARQMPDKHIAAQLNRMGIKSSKGHTWTRVRVGNFRAMNSIPNYSPGERQERGELTIEEVADILNVSYSTVKRMIERGELPATQVCPGAPWIISLSDVESIKAGSSPLSASAKQKSLCL